MSGSWPVVTLGDVLQTVSRPEPVAPTKEYRLLGVRLDNGGPFLRETKLGSQSAATTLFQVQADDFIYSRLFAWRGAFGIVSPELDGCYVSSEFPIFHPMPGQIDMAFLRLWFRLPRTLSAVEAVCTGSTPLTRNRFKERFFLKMRMPLPSLPEQRRIVARIDELAAKIGEAKGLRREAVEEAEALGKSYLDAQLEEAVASFGVAQLQELSAVTDGDHITPVFSDTGIKFIFVGNVSSGSFHFNGCKYVTPAYYQQIKHTRKPERGDVLYSAVGATLGVPAIVDNDEDFCFQRHIAIVKPDRSKLDSRYLWYMLRAGTTFRKAWSYTTGSAQPTIPLRAIKSLVIPIPSLHEQRHIVAYLDGLQAKVDALKALQAETAAELSALLPSVLDRAFSGRL